MSEGLHFLPAPGLRAVCLTLSVRAVNLGGELLTCPGMLIIRAVDGHPVAEEWLPVGDDPTEAEDEHATQRLRAALRRKHGTAQRDAPWRIRPERNRGAQAVLSGRNQAAG
ncbi:hypothetical protein SAMN04487905_108180 [Actinopolyspora xinjiangensis]|uniref:Uncharacterized protein n=1 Tax=Actinopolyspora xinjiangensis TaxID=405564 RepID=A0A1H0VCK5_9ACTN|nr:hypothetical protein [Actinopolyspora xinjiangensis]SDP76160.1 hypothetical protein SAMN04487905_108180 [Actinopolyspora xinjiangensis]